MGLNYAILENVVSLGLRTYDEVLVAARDQEKVQKRRKAVQQRSTPTCQRPPFAHRPSFVQRPPAVARAPGKPTSGPIRRPPPAPAARSQPYPASQATLAVCSHCGRSGHEKQYCRRFPGQCLACGSPDHMIQDCPSRTGATTERAQVPAKAKVFSLTAEEADIAEGVVEGTSFLFRFSILYFLCAFFMLSLSSHCIFVILSLTILHFGTLGTILVHSLPSHVLFDYGASHSFIAS